MSIDVEVTETTNSVYITFTSFYEFILIAHLIVSDPATNRTLEIVQFLSVLEEYNLRAVTKNIYAVEWLTGTFSEQVPDHKGQNKFRIEMKLNAFVDWLRGKELTALTVEIGVEATTPNKRGKYCYQLVIWCVFIVHE